MPRKLSRFPRKGDEYWLLFDAFDDVARVAPAATNLLKDVVMNLRLGGGGVQDRKQFALKIAKDLFQART